MVKIPPFEVTLWFGRYAHGSKHDLAGTAAASISIEDLINLSEHKEKTAGALSLHSINLDYNESLRGGEAVRANLAALYSARAQGVTKGDILITNGGIDANHIVLSALVEPSDHIICHYPTYEQLYQLPRALGADVSLWKTEPSKKWQLDMEELKSMVKTKHKEMIILNNPHNPSGAIISKPKLDEIMEFAAEKNIIVMSDEVFRPIFHSVSPSSEDFPPSCINLGYKKTVVTGSMSKAYSLPGIRVGWIVTRDKEIIEACHRMRDYTTITVSRLDEAVAAEALNDRCIHAILGRNIKNAQKNIEMFQNFIDEHSWACSWVKPVAGTTAMIKFHKMGRPVDDEQFCLLAMEKAGVGLVPGGLCFGGRSDFRGYVRVGLALDPPKVKEGLGALTRFMEEEYEGVPLARK